MTVENDSVDECGTGRHTPPPTYQTFTIQNGVNYAEHLLDPRNNSNHNLTNVDTYELFQISKNTRTSAESTVKICQMLEVKNGIANTIKAIYRLMEVQDGITNTFIPIFSFVLVIQLLFSFINLLSMPYSTASRLSELKAVENLNITKEDMQLILNFAKRHVLVDLRNCISQYL